VIGEDHLLLREWLARLVEEESHEVVASASDGPDLVREAKAHRPDLVSADVRMPLPQTDEGLRAALEIRAAHPEIGILVLADHLEVRSAVELLADAPSGSATCSSSAWPTSTASSGARADRCRRLCDRSRGRLGDAGPDET